MAVPAMMGRVCSGENQWPKCTGMMSNSNRNRIALVGLYNHRSLPVHIFHSLLEDNGYDVRSYYLRREYELGRADARDVAFLADQIAQHRPALLCVSLTSCHFKLAAEITEAVRARIPTTVLWGGIHPTVMPEECLQCADAVCRGEGEDALLEMAQAVRDGGSYDEIANLWVKRNGTIIRNEPRMLRADLDSLPWPRFVAPNRIYLGREGLVDYERGRDRVTTYDIMTTRGCPYSCSYCCNEFLNQFLKGKGPVIRRRSVDNVIAELREALAMFPNLLLVLTGDDVFSLNVPWLREFAEKYPPAIGLPFVCNLHPNHLDEQRLRLLKSAGLRFCVMGVQSGSPSSREELLNRYTK
jgi:anaerobic magnesium-protoporphyrin IX monomethyl ester cyclase